ncbi:MAG: monofunctional biosynthetic peptidoglycan transglycosylase [Nitrospiria bacterium]
MTLVEFLSPLKDKTHKDRVLAVLYFAHRHKSVVSLTVENIREGLKSARAKSWSKVNVSNVLARSGHYVETAGVEGKRRLWKLTPSGDLYVRGLLGLAESEPEIDNGPMTSPLRGPRKSLQRAIAEMLLSGIVLFLAITVTPTIALRWVDPPTSSFILQSYFATPAANRACKRARYPWADWSAISPHVAVAILAAEDQRFPKHSGFDLDSIEDAMRERLVTGRVRGASTISQQLAKNLFLWPGRSWLRKGLEVYFTALIEATWSKRRILEVYLNVAQFGPCTFGIAAASTEFFHKPPASVDPEQAALLAAVLPNPRRLRVEKPSAYVRKRSAWVQKQVGRLGGPNYLREL